MQETRTYAQQERAKRKDKKSGRYTHSDPCEVCGKPAPFSYYSLASVPAGVGLVLCARARCVKLTEGMSQLEVAQYIVKQDRARGSSAENEARMLGELDEWARRMPSEANRKGR